MAFLLDTNVVSEFRKPSPHPGLVAFLGTVDPDDLFLSVITVGEIAAGAEKVRGRDAAFAARLDRWLDELLVRFARNLLPVDVETAMLWGTLTARTGRSDGDILIAASALCHGATLVTRNVRHFEGLLPAIVNPFEAD